MYSFNQIVKGVYKTWTIYLVMEYSIWISMQKGKEWAYTKLSTIFDQKWTTNAK